MSAQSLRRRRIARFSNAVAAICALLTAVAPLLVFLSALFMPLEDLAKFGGLTVEYPGFGDGVRLPLAIAGLFATLPLSFGLIRLATCFHGFARGALFSPETISGLRDFAGAALVWTLLRPVFTAISSLILSSGAPEGSRQLVVQLNGDAVLLAIFALGVLIVSWVLTEAAALSEENAQFI